MTETQTPNPDCPNCGGTGFVPPFMDECGCETVIVAVIVTETTGLPPRTLTEGSKVIWTGGIVDETLEAVEELQAELAAEQADAEQITDIAVDALCAERVDDDIDPVRVWLDDAPTAPFPVADDCTCHDPECDRRHATRPQPDYAAGIGEAGIGEAGIHSDPSISYAPSRRFVGKPISPAQKALIEKLCAERDSTNATVAEALARLDSGAYTAKSASIAIDALLVIPADPAKRGERSNSFDGVCKNCGGRVEAHAGIIRKEDGRWRTYHKDGACLTATEKAALEAGRVGEPGLYKYVLDGVGTYYRVRKSRTTERLYAEKVIPHGDGSVSFAYDSKAIHWLSADDKLSWAEARAFGVAYGACVACGRTLSDARSLVQGYGARCADRYHWPTVTTKQAEAIIDGSMTWEDVTGLSVV
jgi:4-hydroxy-3-methylbut-2-en-1-yl diphosphate synthase IspG/GcpE